MFDEGASHVSPAPDPIHTFRAGLPGKVAYVTGPCEPVMAYDKETGAKLGQAKHPSPAS